MTFSKHFLKRCRQRRICLQMAQAIAEGRWPGTERRGVEEHAAGLDAGHELVVKFRDGRRDDVATVYVRHAINARRLKAERAGHDLNVEKLCVN